MSCFRLFVSFLCFVILVKSETKNLTEICLKLDTNVRVKRQLPNFDQIMTEFMDFACTDGSIVSCLATLVRIAPTR